jgi:hypothetical protein
MFEKSKEEWKFLKEKNSLPETKEIEIVEIEPELKTKEEEFGEKIFNEIFSVEKE